MAISVLPAVSGAVDTAFSITAVSPNVLYGATKTFPSGIYTITCVSTTVTTIEFYSDEQTSIIQTQTVSGTSTINLASTATKVKLSTDTGTDVVVTIERTAGSITNEISGTLDTITESGTYTANSASGYALVGVVGAGGGGGSGPAGGSTYGGGSGGSGGIKTGVLPLTGNISVTIGTAGNGGATNTAGPGAAGNAGNATTFGNFTANGGGGGGGGTNNTGGAAGAAGTPGGAAGVAGNQNATRYGGVPTMIWTALATNPIGNGGSGGAYNTSPTAGTGYGAGGPASLGSGANDATTGRAGRPGVVYVLRY
jgi:hypothetical protein